MSTTWAPDAPTDARHRAMSIINQGTPTAVVPAPDDRALALAVLYAGDHLKRIADLLEQTTRPLPGRKLEPGRDAPQRGLALIAGGRP